MSVLPVDKSKAILPSDHRSAAPGSFDTTLLISWASLQSWSSGATNCAYISRLRSIPGISAKPTSVMSTSAGSSFLTKMLFGCRFFIV